MRPRSLWCPIALRRMAAEGTEDRWRAKQSGISTADSRGSVHPGIGESPRERQSARVGCGYRDSHTSARRPGRPSSDCPWSDLAVHVQFPLGGTLARVLKRGVTVLFSFFLLGKILATPGAQAAFERSKPPVPCFL